jgi:hypothetical protein
VHELVPIISCRVSEMKIMLNPRVDRTQPMHYFSVYIMARNIEKNFHDLELLNTRNVECVGAIRGEMEFIIKTLLRCITKDYGIFMVTP